MYSPRVWNGYEKCFKPYVVLSQEISAFADGHSDCHLPILLQAADVGQYSLVRGVRQARPFLYVWRRVGDLVVGVPA